MQFHKIIRDFKAILDERIALAGAFHNITRSAYRQILFPDPSEDLTLYLRQVRSEAVNLNSSQIGIYVRLNIAFSSLSELPVHYILELLKNICSIEL